jgi:hypothetical protein
MKWSYPNLLSYYQGNSLRTRKISVRIVCTPAGFEAPICECKPAALLFQHNSSMHTLEKVLELSPISGLHCGT